jgi:hypothetical protein
MALMDEGELSPLIREALIDRFEGWELVEFLNVSIERIVELLEEEIIDNIEDVQEELGLEKDNNNED